MRTTAILLLIIAGIAGCKKKKPFDTERFLLLSKEYQLLTTEEKAIAQITTASVPNPDIRIVARICKKINFQSVSQQLNLDIVNPDSNFSYLKFIREQLSMRSRPNPKGPIFVNNLNTAKENYRKFLRSLYETENISSSQYAKIIDKLRQEPVVFPFLVFEWLETMP